MIWSDLETEGLRASKLQGELKRSPTGNNFRYSFIYIYIIYVLGERLKVEDPLSINFTLKTN
jgi:hypothetical protein